MKTIQGFICLVIVCLLSFFALPLDSASASKYVTIEAEIPVSCLEIPDDDTHMYQIIIESENDISPEPRSNILEITENGTGKFEIDIDEPGTFIYIIYENPGNELNIQYDTNIYRVTVFVETDTDDTLNYAISAVIIGNDYKPDSITFQNSANYVTEPNTTTATTFLVTTLTEASTTVTSTVSTTAVTTTASATTTKSNRIIEIVTTVMTGDTMPLKTIRFVIISALFIALLSLIFKKRSKDDDDNE